MNQVIQEAAEQTSHTWLVGIVTVVFMAIFIGIVLWLLSSHDKASFEEAARLPLETDEEDD